MGGLIKLNVMPQQPESMDAAQAAEDEPIGYEISNNNAGEMLDGGKIEDPIDDQDDFDDGNGEAGDDVDDPQNEDVD